jgi:hypothetical protein
MNETEAQWEDALEHNSYTVMGHRRSFDIMADMFFDNCAPNSRREALYIMKGYSKFMPTHFKKEILEKSWSRRKE